MNKGEVLTVNGQPGHLAVNGQLGHQTVNPAIVNGFTNNGFNDAENPTKL